MKFHKIFKARKNIIIGAIHLPPLLGYKNFPGFKIAIKNALADLKALEDGGADSIIFENNYDLPHKILVDDAVISAMKIIGKKIKQATALPIGISVLWNDYRAAISIAKELNLQFVRIPVFVDDVKTDFGVIKGEAKKIIEFRKSIGAENIALFTDIHVKHAQLLSKNDLLASARQAIANRSDAIIITGRQTGNAPSQKKIENLRHHIEKFPIIIGSGLDKNNASRLLESADGAIVSTSLKQGTAKTGERNIKPYRARIAPRKVKELVKSVRTLFIAATHGDETIGIKVLGQLEQGGMIKKDCSLIGNPKALLQQKRYCQADLNRVFPGEKQSRIYEERRAYEILKQTQGYRAVVDIHGTNDKTGIFIIVSNPTPKNLALAKLFDVGNIVLWPPTSNRAIGSLSQFVKCGVGIECGPKNNNATREELTRILRRYLTGAQPKSNKSYFKVYGKLGLNYKNMKLKSFKKTKIGGEIFYPLLVDRYQKIKCYKIKKINPPR